LPAQIRLGNNSMGFFESDLDDWLASRSEQRHLSAKREGSQK
jgi:predicted DNA-binding transcriptional regulator AlpA